jgi:hypothetical protein
VPVHKGVRPPPGDIGVAGVNNLLASQTPVRSRYIK